MIRAMVASVLCFAWYSGAAYAADDSIDRRIPDEYESVGGHALGLGNSGVAALGGPSAVRMNPGLLPLEPQYSVSLGYHWPTFGRDFYQGGVVDSVTSSVAAGVMYTGFNDTFEGNRWAGERDAQTEKRLSLAVAKAFRKVALGLNGQWINGFEDAGMTSEHRKGATFGFGVAGLFTEKVRFGASVENLGNDNVAMIAPQTSRVGFALLMLGGDFSTHLDYRQRQRIPSIEGAAPQIGVEPRDVGFQKSEKMVIGSFSARFYDVLRLLGSYGQAISEDKRQSLSGGVGLVHQNFSLSYDVSRPYLSEKKVHHAVNLNLMMAM